MLPQITHQKTEEWLFWK